MQLARDVPNAVQSLTLLEPAVMAGPSGERSATPFIEGFDVLKECGSHRRRDMCCLARITSSKWRTRATWRSAWRHSQRRTP
jgi:hypothetical protein